MNLGRNILRKARIKKALELYSNRVITNQHIDPIECLQYCDKRKIILEKREYIYKAFNEPSKENIEHLLKEAEED